MGGWYKDVLDKYTDSLFVSKSMLMENNTSTVKDIVKIVRLSQQDLDRLASEYERALRESIEYAKVVQMLARKSRDLESQYEVSRRKVSHTNKAT